MDHQGEEFPRLARMGEFLGLINSTGLLADSGGNPIFHQIEFIEPIPEIILTGPTALAIDTPTEIAAAQIQRLQMPSNELLQARFVIGSDGGVFGATTQIVVRMAQLRATSRHVTSRVQGRWSVVQQGFAPRIDDLTATTALVSATAVPQRYSLAQFWQTEHYIFEDDTPIYTVENVGSGAVGGGIRVDLLFTGWRYILSIAQPQADWTEHRIFGKTVLGPRVFTRVPVTGVGR